ncbi:MAG: CPBP family intramembrane metalloprotease [Chloroflexi bacterium]|nr:CPBP family intramembrane metalloprotease [Chloroflexota bacterium]
MNIGTITNGVLTIGGVAFDLKLLFFIVLGTVVPMLDYYNYRLTSLKAYDRVIFYFIIPMLIILLLFRESPSDYGFQWGNWRVGLAWTAVAAVGMAIILWYVARTPGMQKYYDARAPKEVTRLIYLTGVDLFGWEFIWRGFLLFGIARILGPGPAIMIQAIPFAFMHLGKPEVETLSTIFGGIGFGFIAWQSQSFVYPWLIHWFIASFTMLIASGRI